MTDRAPEMVVGLADAERRLDRARLALCFAAREYAQTGDDGPLQDAAVEYDRECRVVSMVAGHEEPAGSGR